MQTMELTSEQRAKWDTTMSLMAWKCPGFRHLFYKLLSNNKGQYTAVMTPVVPIAATDAKNILINPDTYFEYDLEERVAILIHEVLHNVFGDVELMHRCAATKTVPTLSGKKQKPFVSSVMQQAMDYRINALIRDSKLGKLPEGTLYDEKIATAADSVFDVYEKLYKKMEDEEGEGGDGGDGEGEGDGNQGPGNNDILQPGASTGQDPNDHQRSEKQWAVETQTAKTLEAMRYRGDMPGSLNHMFKEILDPEVPWTEHIKSLVHRHTGSGTYTWRRPDRRHINRDLYMPSRTGFGAGKLAAWADTSGSCYSNEELSSYVAELGAMLEDVRPQEVEVFWCDSKIHRVDVIHDTDELKTILYKGAPGGGSTSMMPVLKELENRLEQPEMLICFTDGYVQFPKVAPPYPVIWASLTDDVKYPFGEVVKINTKGKARRSNT